jgi:hypothetical protein
MDGDRNDKVYRNLVLLLKMFRNRPNHLAKFLLDNNSFNKKFLDKILSSTKLNELDQKELDKIAEEFENQTLYDITGINEHYQSIIVNEKNNKLSIEQLEKELNDKLSKALSDERYEDAVRIRDYMMKHNIKKL